MENTLVTPDDLRTSEKLHREYEAAQRERERQQPALDQLELAFEDARMRIDAASASGNTPMERIEELRAAVDQAEKARDQAQKAADAPLKAAEQALRAHTGRFISAAAGWAGWIQKNHDGDEALSEFVQASRREFEGMQKRLETLPEINVFFEKVRDRLEGWRLPEPPKSGWFTSQKYPTRMMFPRISDWLQ